MSKFIFVHKSGIKCHFGGFLTHRCPLMPQRYDARIVFCKLREWWYDNDNDKVHL